MPLRRFLLVLLLCTASAARAEPCPEPKMATRKARSDTMLQLESRLASDLALIEGVPPDVEAYLDREREEFIRSFNTGRWAIAAANRFYRPSEVFRYYETLKKDLAGAHSAKTYADEAVRWAASGYHANDLKESLAEYSEFDSKRSPRVLLPQQTESLRLSVSMVSSFALRSAQCTIREMREP